MLFRPGNVSHLGRIGLTAATVQYNPLQLFAAGEQGVWYDPSDLSTLFQDSAGTTPVTAVGQPVGRMLDKSGRGNHAFQATAIDRPTLQQDSGGRYYLSCNGTNTWMQTSAINFTSTDEMTVFTGVRKLSDTSVGILMEISPVINTNNGTFALRAPHSALTANYGALFNGTVLGGAISPSSYASPVTNVLCASADISADITLLRVNGTQVTLSTGDLGAGTFGNYVLYLFRRAGTSSPFNGYFYGALIRGATCNDQQTKAIEKLLAQKSGVAI